MAVDSYARTMAEEAARLAKIALGEESAEPETTSEEEKETEAEG